MKTTERKKTTYLVLERVRSLEEERYDLIGRADTHGPVAAVKAVTSGRDLPESASAELFVAVPLSNWTAVAKSVERTEPVVKYVALETIGAPVTEEGQSRGPVAVPPIAEDDAAETQELTG